MDNIGPAAGQDGPLFGDSLLRIQLILAKGRSSEGAYYILRFMEYSAF